MDANKLVNKIIKQELDLASALKLCEMICSSNKLTIGEVLWIKDLLNLTNLEAIEIFLT